MTESDEPASPWGEALSTECPSGYPVELEQYVTLQDGRRVFVRPVIPADELVLEHELRGADTETLYQRFFTPRPTLNAQMRHSLYHVDYRWRLALVAFAKDGQAVGIGRYEGVLGQDEAEVAFVVKPGWRRAGLSTTLLQLLVASAQAQGIQRLVAFCLWDNHAIAALLTKFGFIQQQASDGVAVAEKKLQFMYGI